MIGLTMLYRHGVKLTSKRDSLELGVAARVDFIDQTDTRLFADGTTNTKLVDASISAMNIGAYLDASLYPVRRVVIRGGPRLDSLSYSVTDHLSNAGTDRTSQGFDFGNKVMADVAAGHGVHLVASYGEGFRSPKHASSPEGERVPFTTVRGMEGGLRYKEMSLFQASATVFGSWLGHDRVFDAVARENIEAPPSVRVGAAAAITVHAGPVGTSVSATYTRARFSGSEGAFHDGDPVPYAPELVLRDDTYLAGRIGRIAGTRVTGRVGVSVEGIVGRPLPQGGRGEDFAQLDGCGHRLARGRAGRDGHEPSRPDVLRRAVRVRVELRAQRDAATAVGARARRRAARGVRHPPDPRPRHEIRLRKIARVPMPDTGAYGRRTRRMPRVRGRPCGVGGPVVSLGRARSPELHGRLGRDVPHPRERSARDARLADDPYGAWFAGTAQALITAYLPTLMLARFRRFALYMQVRTRVIDDVLREFIASGGDQVLLLGAGYDCRAARFANELRRARVFEVDHPATQAKKRVVLERRHAPSAPVTYLAWISRRARSRSCRLRSPPLAMTRRARR